MSIKNRYETGQRGWGVGGVEPQKKKKKKKRWDRIVRAIYKKAT